MGNRNKKVVRIKPGQGMMDQAVKDIMEVSQEVENQLEIKRGMMQSVLDTVEEGFRRNDVDVKLRLTEDGYEFLFSDIQDYLTSDDEDDELISLSGMDINVDMEDEDGEPVEMFGGMDDDGNSYSILVGLAQNEEDDEAFDMNIAVMREVGGRPQLLTDGGWEELELQLPLD